MKKGLLCCSLMALSGCSGIRVLNPKSETAEDQAFLIWFSLGIMLLVLAVVLILWVRFVWKYRESRQKDNPNPPTDVKGNKLYETIWTLGPIVLLIILAVPTVAITYNQSPVTGADKSKSRLELDKHDIHIQVTGQQFHWTFRHEGGKEEQDKLVLPAGRNVFFHLRSKDVIHSFWIPNLGGKTDVMPHQELIYEIKNAKKGTYQGRCAEYCGVDHAHMRFTAEVVSPEEYENYIQEEK